MHMNRLPLIYCRRHLVALPTLMTIQAEDEPRSTPHSTKLWAAISVPEPVFQAGQTGKLQVYFAVVNDGDTAISPKIGSSHFFINGDEPKDWLFVINSPTLVDCGELHCGETWLHQADSCAATGNILYVSGVIMKCI